MPSERMQRRIYALLDEADAALASGDWQTVSAKALNVLALDETNEEASVLRAAAIQQALAGHEVTRVRIGLHTGNPVQEGEDFFGTDVNFAARVADHALGGQVLVSARLHDLLDAARPARFGEPLEVEFKGFSGKHRVYTVVLP